MISPLGASPGAGGRICEADMDLGMCQLGIEDERILASFSRRLIETAIARCGCETGAFVTNALDMMCLPAIVLDRHGFVVEVNAHAHAVLDVDIYIKDDYFSIRDREACARLKTSLNEMTKPVQLKSSIAEPILIQRRDNLPVVLRTLPFNEPTQSPEQEVHAVVMLPTQKPDPGHPQRLSPRIYVV
jgi:hypothetical protein